MNTTTKVLAFFFIVVSLVACSQKEPEIPTPKLTFTEKVDADFQSISLSCTVSGNVTAERLAIEYSKDAALSGAVKKSFDKKGDGFVLSLTGLDIQTTYYYRYIVENKASAITDEKIRQFKTLDYVVPVVVTGDVKNISGTKATLEGRVEFACGKEILEQGFYFGTDSKSLEAKPAGADAFSLSVDGLTFETTYYYQAYAKSEIGTGKGEIKEFKTNNAVSFNPVTIDEVMATSVSVKGGIADNGGVDLEVQGFRYCEGTSGSVVLAECTGSKTITELKPSTSYSIWYYAKTFEGEFESDKVEFETKDGVILITTSTPENVNTTTATLNANISSDGGSAIIERGFCYGKNDSPTLSDTRIKVSGTTGEYQHTLSNLPQNTKYYVRAYAINGIGTYFGESISFVTLYDSVIFGTTSCSDVTASSASFVGSITSNGGSAITRCGFCYSTSALPTVNDNVVEVTGSTTSLKASVKNLKSGVTYHVRAFATNANSTFYSDEITFVTSDGIIQFANPSVSNILAASATVISSIVSAGGGTITERGFCYGKTQSPTTSGSTVKSAGTSGEFSASLTGLDRNAVYYVRAYAINETGTHYSEEGSFTTMNGIASITTLSATNVKALTATLNGEIVSDGGSTITERGFCYSTSPNPTTNNNPVKISGTIGTISKDLTNLIKDTKYYVRAYAVNSYGTYYGNEIVFTTSDGNVTFSNLTSSEITVSSISVSTSLTSDGGSSITKRGFCYSTHTSPTVSDEVLTVSGNTGTMSSSITGLKNNTIYYIRAYATNGTGTSYSSELSVSTLSGLAEVETSGLNSIMAQSVEVSGNVISANGGSISSRGFCYGTNENPTISDSKVTVTGTTGTMSKTITGLTVDTKYYIRAFATTSFGTSYGNILTFTTEDGAVAFSTVSTSNILATTVDVSVSVYSNGGSTITERGFCYSTNENPTVSGAKVQSTTSTDTYSTNLSSLDRSTRYYIRAYAKNSTGTYYSSQASFSTLSGLASFTALSATDVAQTTIGLSCNITSNGGAEITQRGFCYSTSPNPTTNSQLLAISGTIGELSGTLTGLKSNQQYYIRAYAKTLFGTAYSNEVVVTTDAGLVSFDGMSVNEIQPQSAKFNSKIIALGGANITELGFCYGTHPDLTTNDITITAESSVNQFWATPTNLEQNTTYYARPYAINMYGTSYGDEVSFKTSYYSIDFSSLTASNVLMRSAHLSCVVTTDTRNNIIEMGICISKTSNPTVTVFDKKISSSTKNMSIDVSTLDYGTTYYARPYLTNAVGTFYGSESSFTTLNCPEGAAPGVFSVADDGKYVFLAKGNLEYNEATKVFSFSETQLASTSGDICYFIWGWTGSIYTSAYSNLANDTNNAYYCSLQNTKYDWGFNPIENGGNEGGLWTSLLYSEWTYLLTERVNADALKRTVTINGKKGLLVLPDDWVYPQDISSSSEIYSKAEWAKLEALGAVFFAENIIDNEYSQYAGGTTTWYHIYDTPFWTAEATATEGRYYHIHYKAFVLERDSTNLKLDASRPDGTYGYVRLAQYVK